MKEERRVPKFAHLQYEVLHELEISIAEYFMLDMVHHLSGSGKYWCNKKLESIALDMRLTKRGVTEMRNRLIERKLLIKGASNRLKTPEKVNKVYYLDESPAKKRTLSSQKQQKVLPKRTLSVAKTPVESYRRLTLDNREVKSKAKERIRKAYLKKDWSSLK